MIRYKTIEHERSEDAPFMGALISAIDCHFNCKNCFNQHIKDLPTIEDTASSVIAIVKANPFNQGIILAGLEWTEQTEAMRELVFEALANKLQVAIYTGMEESQFKDEYPELYRQPIYIKFGRYKEDMKTNSNIQYGVRLASSNQYFYKGGLHD